MPAVTADVHVDAPPAACFDYLGEPTNHTAFVPGLTAIDKQPLPDGGHEGEFTYRLFGIPLTLRYRDVELDPPHRRVYEVTGRLTGRATYTLDAEDDGTRFTFENRYDIPGPDLLERLGGPILERYLRREAETTVRNARREIESRQ